MGKESWRARGSARSVTCGLPSGIDVVFIDVEEGICGARVYNYDGMMQSAQISPTSLRNINKYSAPRMRIIRKSTIGREIDKYKVTGA